MVKSELLALLKTEVVDIEFVKNDGTTRVMTCTLREESLPVRDENARTKASNPDVLPVFDTINQGWRAFRWDSLKKVNGEAFV